MLERLSIVKGLLAPAEPRAGGKLSKYKGFRRYQLRAVAGYIFRVPHVTPDHEKWLLFSVEQVCQLTGLTPGRLSYWKNTGFFSPQYGPDPETGIRTAFYTFRDVVGLRTLALMRQRGVTLQGLRKIGEYLHRSYETPWSSLRFYVGGKERPAGKQRVAGKQPYFVDPATGQLTTHRPEGQRAFRVDMEEIAHGVRNDARSLQARKSEDIGRVDQRRNVAHNAPVIAGTRVPTAAIFAFSEEGYNTAAILKEYPGLTADDIERAIEYERERHARRTG